MIKNMFDPTVVSELVDRINRLTPDTHGQWGKMSVGQMLAHCNVSYEMIYEDKHPKPNAFMKFIVRNLIKNMVVNEKPYKHNMNTAPAFKMTDSKNFESEKERLIGFINKTQQLGSAHFEGKESHSFGALTQEEWNNMLYKHLDHHLNQFGV